MKVYETFLAQNDCIKIPKTDLLYVPVELVDVLYVSKKSTHLFWPYGKVAYIDNVSQVILKKQ